MWPAFDNCEPKGDYERVAVKLKTGGLLCAAVLSCLLPAAAIAGLSSEGNTDGVLTWHLGRIEPGRSAVRTVLFAYGDSLEELRSVVEAAKGKARGLGGQAHAGGAIEGEIAWLRNSTTSFGLEPTGSFSAVGNGPALSGQLYQFNWYIRYNDGTERTAGVPIWSDARRRNGHNRDEPENMRVVGGLSGDSNQAAVTLETTDRELHVTVRAMVLEGPTAAAEFTLANTAQDTIEQLELSVLVNIDAGPRSTSLDCSVVDSSLGGIVTINPLNNRHVAFAGNEQPTRGYCGKWPSEDGLRDGKGTPFEAWKRFAGLSKETRRRLIRGYYMPATLVEPNEPPTKTLSTAEAKKLIEADWLYQAEDNLSPRRVADEIKWTRELALRLRRDHRTRELSTELAELERLSEELQSSPKDADRTRRLYLAVRRVKRRIMFSNPTIDFDSLLFIDNPYPLGSEWPHEVSHRNGRFAVAGGRLLILKGLHPGGKVKKLAPEKPGSFWRPDVSFDAKKALFCYKAHDEQSFHLYEMNIDGTGLRQFTSGPYDDLDPLYLPDGHIVFSTTRSNTYLRCGPYMYTYVLARCDADGGNIYLISRGNESEWLPSLLEDGRVIYSRWEYTDKALWRVQSLWTTNPDGTNTSVFWGNQSIWPDHVAEPRPIPGDGRVMFTGTAHHNWFSGSIGIINQKQGFNFPNGLTKVTAEVPWPECSQPPQDPLETPSYHASGNYTAYKTPYPLTGEDFLVSARLGGKFDDRTRNNKFKLYLMDIYGNRELIYEGEYNIWHAIPVRPRQAPPIIPDRVTWPGTGKNRRPVAPGVLFSGDVYQGVPDIPRGMVRYLRVIQADHKTYSTWFKTDRHSGPGVSVIQEDSVKRILGTAPVAEDGSVAFTLPAGKAVYFQLLDEDYRALQTMRSFTGVMPGEKRGCVGCHEMHSTAPVGRKGTALRASPAELAPPPWGNESVGFDRFVQPVLDKYCGSCHQGDGQGREQLDMTPRPGDRWCYTEPYLTLVGKVSMAKSAPKDSIAGAMLCENFTTNDPNSLATFRPMRHLSYTSRLIHNASSGDHHGVKVDPYSLRRLIAWVDTNCPFRGEEEIRKMPDPNFPGVEFLPVRPRLASAPVVERP
ncbi:MAG TPA: hypothetical protein VMX13_17070 [Sedimentisphaerales bacterium]|nr:hypothetical protein [Sedimentisphaerales bacterium]